MKQTNKTLAALAVFAATSCMYAEGALIVGWDTWVFPNGGANNSPTTHNAAGFSGSQVYDTTWSYTGAAASTDGTFGTLASPTTAITNGANSDGLVLNNGANGFLDFTITNSSGASTTLDFFHFDTSTFRPNAAHEWDVSITAGDLTAQTILSGSADNIAGGTWDPYSYDVDLSGLTGGNTLANGQTVTFRLNMSGGTASAGHHQGVDNVAISGTAVPEPSSVALLGLGGLALILRRRK